MFDLLALIRDQKSRRGISVVELEELAGVVQNFYRGSGYPLAARPSFPHNGWSTAGYH